MSAAPRLVVPEIALSVACLTTISPHLSGVYAVNVYDGEVKLQGLADEVAHLVADLNLTRGSRLDHVDNSGNRYETWEGAGPREFSSVAILLVAVVRDADA